MWILLVEKLIDLVHDFSNAKDIRHHIGMLQVRGIEVSVRRRMLAIQDRGDGLLRERLLDEAISSVAFRWRWPSPVRARAASAEVPD